MTSSTFSSLGWIGTGVMGRSMAKHLMNAGYPLNIFSRTKEKAQGLLDKGARWCFSCKEVTQKSTVTFVMVGFPNDVEEVFLGKTGLLVGVGPNTTIVDMTTTKPSLAQDLDRRVRKKGGAFLDAPVSGGDVGAMNATLSIMVGGERSTFEEILPLFQYLGKNIVYQGKAGSGQHTKMCNQITIASTMIGVCEALLYGHQAGLNLTKMLQSISKGAAGCWTLENLVPRMLERNFEPGFLVDHFLKDMGIALEEAERMKLKLPGLELAHRLYKETQRMGHGAKGTHALYLALEKMAKT